MKVATGEVSSNYNILSFSNFKKFGAETEEEYLQKIDSMNLSDLQAHAIGVGVLPNNERPRMKRILLSEFKKSQSRYKVSILPRQERNAILENKVSQIYKR